MYWIFLLMVFVGICWFLSVSVGFFLFLLVFVDICWFLSVFVGFCWFLSVFAGFVVICWFLLVFVGFCWFGWFTMVLYELDCLTFSLDFVWFCRWSELYFKILISG